MNRTETAGLIAYLNRAGLVGAMEGQSAVWADALSDIRTQDAQDVAREIVKTRKSTERWVTPGDVRQAVINLRRNRVMRAPGGTPPNPDNYYEWTKEWSRRLGDGDTPVSAYIGACETVGDEPEEQTVKFLEGATRPPVAEISTPPRDAWMQ